MAGRIPGHQCDGSGGQHHVLQQELSHQGEQGEACHPWSNHENGQRPGKQHQGEQSGIAHPQASDEQDASNDFKRAEHIDERAEGQERK